MFGNVILCGYVISRSKISISRLEIIRTNCLKGIYYFFGGLGYFDLFLLNRLDRRGNEGVGFLIFFEAE